MAKLLIIGRMPPPIGGVTAHVQRLTKGLQRNGFEFDFCETNSIFTMVRKVMRHGRIHIHCSNPWIQLALAVFCRVTRKKLIVTYHGCWGRYNAWGNRAVAWSAALAYIPIVQDCRSLTQALRCNPRAQEISTYIAEPEIVPLPGPLASELNFRRRQYQATFCTNAWSVTFDRYGQEIYGISEMIQRFMEHPEFQLVISDPSGKYRSYIHRHTPHITHNIFFINQLHDFKNILLLSDAFIRNTSTDGVSLSIHEAYELGIPVMASAAVPRPPFCSTFGKFSHIDIKQKLQEAKMLIKLPGAAQDTVKMLMEVYRSTDRKVH